MSRRVRRFGRLAACAALLGAYAGIPGAFGAELVSHRALYELTLKSLTSNSNVVGAQGAMSVDWSHSCDGWTINQRLRMTLDLQNQTRVMDVSFSSFESDDGLTYNFTTRTTRDGRVAEEFRGAVQRSAIGDAAVARYSVPQGREVVLPPGTVFPMAHTRDVLDAAARGERTIWRRFFDGPRPDESPFGANVLVTGGPKTGEEGPGAGLAPLMDARWWPLRIAFFPGGGQAAEPDFEVEAKTQDNGVVREFVFDYGDFTMLATLSQIEPVAEPTCGG